MLVQWKIISLCGGWLSQGGWGGKRKVGLGILFGALVIRTIVARGRRRRVKEKMRRKREEVAARKAVLEQSLCRGGELLSESRQLIVAMEVEALLAALRSGEVSPQEVLEAFQAKALVVDRDINAICDFIVEATDWAANLANLPEGQRGPLFGLPVSVKECFLVKGYDATIGLAQYIDKPAAEDCHFVAALKELGAVPFCLTNVPQTMVSYACSNPVFGATENPWCKGRSPGGSSGGEAALIAAGGSLLGIGSDVGGSLRIPAHFSGCVGLKPTTSASRIYEGGRRAGVGAGSKSVRTGFYSAAGFMASSVSGIEIGMRALLTDAHTMAARDWRVAPLPWIKSLASPERKLKIGYYLDDGIFPPTPGVVRAVQEVVDLLKKDGHQVELWQPPGLEEIFNAFVQLLLADKGFHFLRTMKNEEIDEAIEVNAMNFKSPPKLKKVMALLFRLVSKKLSFLWSAGAEMSHEGWVQNAHKDRLIYQLTSAWEKSGLDVLLCPAFAMPAAPNALCSRLLPAASYTCVYNLVGCPAGIVPVTRETAEDQAGLANYPVGSDFLHRVARNATIGAEGCPIGVQVVGRHYQEEMVIHAMKEVERLVKSH